MFSDAPSFDRCKIPNIPRRIALTLGLHENYIIILSNFDNNNKIESGTIICPESSTVISINSTIKSIVVINLIAVTKTLTFR